MQVTFYCTLYRYRIVLLLRNTGLLLLQYVLLEFRLHLQFSGRNSSWTPQMRRSLGVELR
jgi:hypothetical protein